MVEFSRRNFLGAAGAAAATATVGATAAGCSGNAGGVVGGDYDMPTYQPAPSWTSSRTTRPTPLACWTSTPSTRRPTSSRSSASPAPAARSRRSSSPGATPPSPLEENPYWQELNERVGVSFEPQFVPQPVFYQKFATMLASGDVPDLVFLDDQNAACPAGCA